MTSAGLPIQIRQAAHGVMERFGGRHHLGGRHGRQGFRIGHRGIGNFYGSRAGGALRGYRLVASRCAG